MTKSTGWYAMTEGQQYAHRERAIRELGALGVFWVRHRRPDHAEAAYRAALRLRDQNDVLADLIARRAAAWASESDSPKV